MSYPKEELSQEIGRLAGKIFAYEAPTNWILTELSGDTDFGIDYFVQLKDSNKEVKFSFNLQLKGTTQNKYSACGKYITHSFDVKTLNYYKNNESIVAIAIVDFSKGLKKYKEAPVYYYLLEDDWFKQHEDKLKNQKEISIKIPTSNVFDSSLDILEYYQQRIDKTQTYHVLGETISRHSGSGLTAINEIADAINTKPFIVDALREQTDAPWIDNPKGRLATQLKEIDSLLAAGNIAKAQNAMDELERGNANNGEFAEYYRLEGLLLERQGKGEAALQSFIKARTYSSSNRYLISLLNGYYFLSPLQKEPVKTLSKQLNNQIPEECVLKAKSMIMTGDVDEGIALLKENHPDKKVSLMFLLMLGDKFEELDLIIDSYDTTLLPDERSKFLYYAIKARRQTEKIIKVPLNSDRQIVPNTGEKSYDKGAIFEAKETCDLVWSKAKLLGYPGDTAFLLDFSMLIYGFCGQQKELIEHFEAMLKQSFNNPYLIECYSVLLFNSQKHQENYTLLAQVDHLRVGEAILLAISCHHLKKYDELLNIVNQYEKEIVESGNELAPMVFCLAEGASDELFEVEDAERFGNILKTFDAGNHLKQIRTYIELANKDRENITTHINQLYDYYLSNGKPFIIAFQLLPAIDCTTEEGAQQIVTLAEDILQIRELTEEEYFQFCNALMTIEDWRLIESIADKQIQLRVISNQWHFLKALALNNRGEIGKSYAELEQLFTCPDDFTTDNVLFYTDICLKLGFLEKAEKVIKKQLSKTKDPAKKKQLLHALIHIYTYDKVDQTRKFAKVLQQYSQYVDPDNEQDESTFLTIALFAPAHVLDVEYLKRIQNRFDQFFEKFPQSLYLRKASISEEENANDIIERLTRLAGVDNDKNNFNEQNKLAIRNGTLPMPLCFLHNCIRETRDVYHSWELSKTSDSHLFEFKILHAPYSGELTQGSIRQSSAILIEETTLLTLYELDLLSSFLGQLDEFALLESVFDSLTRAAHSIGGSVCANTARGVLGHLRQHVHKLKTIPVVEDVLKTYALEAAKESVILLTDDRSLFELARIDNPDISHGNTIDCLSFLVDVEAITKVKFYEKVIQITTLGFIGYYLKFSLIEDILSYYQGLKPEAKIEELPCEPLVRSVI